MECGLLQSEHDVRSYDEYIAGKRKYFTIEGMTIEKNTSDQLLHKDPIAFLKAKYTTTSFSVSTKIAEDYIKAYEMDGGIVKRANTKEYYDRSVGRHKPRVGQIAYIKDSFLFIAYIWTVPDFARIEDSPEKAVEESFVNNGRWDYNTYDRMNEYIVSYQLHLDSIYRENELKKLREEVSKLADARNFDIASVKQSFDVTLAICDNLMDIIEKQNQIPDDTNKMETAKKLAACEQRQSEDFNTLKSDIGVLDIHREVSSKLIKNSEIMMMSLGAEMAKTYAMNVEATDRSTVQLSNHVDKFNKHVYNYHEMEYEINHLITYQKAGFDKKIQLQERHIMLILAINVIVVCCYIINSINWYQMLSIAEMVCRN